MYENKIAKRHRQWILIAMTLTLAMISIDQSIAPVTLPRIQRNLSISSNSLLWVINAYLLAFTVMAAIGGRIGDIFGRVRTLIFGVSFFAVSTLLCGLAGNFLMLITARICQGMGAAFFITASAAIVMANFDIKERGKAMAFYNSGAMILMIIGTFTGGYLTDVISWRWAFFINIPIAIIIQLIVFIVKPKDEFIKGQKINFINLLLLVVSMTLSVLAIQQAGKSGLRSTITLSMLLGGFSIFIIYILAELRSKNPLISFHLLKERNFTANVIILGLFQFACIGQGMFGALYLQQILSFSPTVAGGWSVVTIIIIAICVQFGGRIFDRTGARFPVISGLVFIAFGYLWQAPLLTMQNIYYLIPGLIALGIGIGFLMPASYTDALNRIPAQIRGQASGVIENARQIGGTLGIAVCGAIVNTLETIKIREITVKAGKSPDMAEHLNGILSLSPGVQKTKAILISSDWQGIISSLKTSLSQCYSSSYFLAGGIMLVCIAIASVMLSHERQTNDSEA